MNVLVADDMKTIRTMLIRALNKLGVDHADEAADGLEAMELLRAKTYHLIIVDHYMPHHLGIELVLEARARGCVGPIIMQTTEAHKSSVMRALHAGVTDYILKPFSSEYLLDRLEEHTFEAEMIAAAEISAVAARR